MMQLDYAESPSDSCLVLRLKCQIKIISKTDHIAFGLRGDSGSVVLNDASRVIGLLHTTPAKEDPADSTDVTAVASPIVAVQSQLKIKLADSATYHGIQRVPKPAAAHAFSALPPAVFLQWRRIDGQR